MDILKPRFNNVDEILFKEPFTRGGAPVSSMGAPVEVGSKKEIFASTRMMNPISQDRYLAELDPSMHDIHFDDNVPTIVARVKQDGGWGLIEMQYRKMALAYQRKIAEKQTLYLTGKPMKLTMYNHAPTEEDRDIFTDIKEEWISKNMDVSMNKMVHEQKTTADAAMLMYFDKRGRISSKVYSYSDGYTLIPHYDIYGEMDFFAMSYMDKGTETLECYDEENHYRFQKKEGAKTWTLTFLELHGFDEVPVAYKRGRVAWEDAQSIIEVLEVIYNIYTVIMKRHGWGLLYIKGRIDPKLKKTAGAVILNDPDPDSRGEADFKAPPTPEGMENLIKDLRKQIHTQTSTVFLDPEDIKLSSQPSGIAIKMLLNAAIERAMQDAKDWDDIADKICRLFIFGLGRERGAFTKYNAMKVRASFEVWVPQSESEISQNINVLKASGVMSTETGSSVNPYAQPDEYDKIMKEEAYAAELKTNNSKAIAENQIANNQQNISDNGVD